VAVTTTLPVPSAPPAPGKKPHRWRPIAAVVVVAAAIGFLLLQVGDATVFFKTADEAVRDRASLGNHRFRLEGVVVSGSVQHIGDGLTFRVASKGVEVPVSFTGNEPPLFKQAQIPPPVVLEGRFQGDTFVSDKMLVKHTESYTKQHPARVNGSENQP